MTPWTAQASAEFDRQLVEAEQPAAPSWAPEDLSGHLDGTHEPVVPSRLPRTDGQCLLYAGKVNGVHGESESGKSLLLHAESARLLRLGEHVVIVDYESTAATVVPRLLLMGTPPDAVREGLRYVRPQRSPLDPAEQGAWQELLSRPAALVVLDGVTEALATMGRSTLDNDEITGWMQQVPRQLAQRTGAAVVLVDHVTKSTEGRGRFAIGAQAKMSTLDGASYSVEVVQPLGRGLRGSLRLWVGKDREGAVRPYCGRFSSSDRTQLAATVVVDSTAGPITVDLQPPDELIGCTRRPFRPTCLMEQISRAIEATPDLTSNALVKESDLVKGKGAAKRTALNLLVAEGFVERTPHGQGHRHSSLQPYREAVDLAQDQGPTSGGSGAPGRVGPGSPLGRGTRDPVLNTAQPGPGPIWDPAGPGDPEAGEWQDELAPWGAA